MKARLDYVVKQCKLGKHQVLETVKGKELKGLQYKPLFNYFEERRESNCFSVITDNYVTTDAGTGVVHQSPGFGEDDYRCCITHGLIKPGDAVIPVDQDGKFLASVKDYAGQYIKDADKVII